MENLIVLFFSSLPESVRATIAPLALVALAGVVIWGTYRFLRMSRDHDTICKFIGEIRQSIADPDKTHEGQERYLTRAEMVRALAEILVVVKNKGCLENCPALPVMMRVLDEKLEAMRRDHADFLQRSLVYREETAESVRTVFERIDGFMDRQVGIIEILAKKKS